MNKYAPTYQISFHVEPNTPAILIRKNLTAQQVAKEAAEWQAAGGHCEIKEEKEIDEILALVRICRMLGVDSTNDDD